MRLDEAVRNARAIIESSISVTVFSGAGLSAESGLSTFRDKGSNALWSRFDPVELASVQGFEANPQRVIEWYNWRRSTHAGASPNPGHLALASVGNLAHITQNVDNLLEKAGTPADCIHHVHGTITRDRCHNPACDYVEDIDLRDPPPLRECPHCAGLMRPAVVWFGESLPEPVWESAQGICRQTDCLLVVGTSATVYPAAGLVHLAVRHGSRVIIVNRESSGASDIADVELLGPAGEILPRLLD